MAFTLGPFKINLNDKLRTGFRVKYNLLHDKVIRDGEAIPTGFKLITHDGSELEIDLTEFFYSKEILDEMFFIEYATEEEAGIIRIATMEEVLAGEDDLTAVTPYKLWQMLLTFNGRAVIAGEDLLPGDMVYLYFPEDEEEDDDEEDPLPPPEEQEEGEVVDEPEDPYDPFDPVDTEPGDPDDPENPDEEPSFVSPFPVLTAMKALATDKFTVAMGFVEYEALAGEETFIRFSGNVSTFHEDLVPGAYYYLSVEIPGAITILPPNLPGAFIQTVGYAVSDLELMLELERPELIWGPVFLEEIPRLYFAVDTPTSDGFLITDYLQEWNIVTFEPETEEDVETYATDGFSYRFLNLPDWVTIHTVIFDFMEIGGTPTEPGVWDIFLEVIDAHGRRYLQEITLEARPAPIVLATLYDTSAGDLVVGPLPGVYPLPDKWDTEVKVISRLDAWQSTIKGGGDRGGNVELTISSGVIEETDSVTFRHFAETNGITSEAGQFRWFITTILHERIVGRKTINFTLTDEEFLKKVKQYITKGGEQLGEILLDGTSEFVNPLSWNGLSVVDDVEHTRAVVTLAKEGTVIATKEYTHGTAVLVGEYTPYDADTEQEEGLYTLEIHLYLMVPNPENPLQQIEEEVLVRYGDFTINKEKVKPVGGKLKLVTKVANTTNHKVLGELALEGNLFPLPANWDVLSDDEAPLHNSVDFQLFQYRGTGLVEIDVSKYTGNPQSKSFKYPVAQSPTFLFGDSNSTLIDGIHKDKTAFRAIFNRRMDGEVVQALTGDYTFGDELIPIDEVPIKDPSSDIAEVKARLGMSEQVKDFIKYLDVRVDNLTLEIKSPTNPLINYLQIKEKAVVFKLIQDIPTKTVIGRLAAGTGVSSAIKILDLLSDGEEGVTSPGYVKDLLEGLIDGTANYIPRFDTDGHSLIDSTMFQYQGNIGIGLPNGVMPVELLDVGSNIRTTKRLISTVATGTAPLGVLSTTLVENLHADMLNKSVLTPAGSGLTGGGLMTVNRSLAVIFGTVAGTVAQGNDPRFTTGIAGNERWIGNPIEFGSIDNINKGGVRTWGSAAGGPTTFGTSLTFVGSSTTGDSAVGSFVHQMLAGTNGEWFVRYGSGAGPTWGATYQLWTTKHFTSVNIANWNTAFSWGDHAGLYVPIARKVNAGVGLLGGGPLTADVTLRVDFGVVAGTAVEGNDPRVNAGNNAEIRWIPGGNIISDINNITNGGVRSWASSAANRPSSIGSVLTFAGNSSTGNAIAGGYMNQLLAGQDENWFVRTGAGSPTSWGATYQLWTTKQFTAAKVATWDLAYSWGDHSIVGYALALNAVANNVNGLNWNTAHVDGRHKLHGSATNSPTGFSHYGMTVTSADGQTAVSMAFRNGSGFFKTVEGGSVGDWIQFADRAWVNAKQVLAGNGLTGGSNLASNPVITLGLPSTITNATTNSVSATSHTHDIQVANLLAGTNVSLSASGTGVILGANNITINVNSVPWSTGVSAKPTTLSGFGILDGVTSGTYSAGLATKEDNFAKGNFINGANVQITNAIGRLYGALGVTISVPNFPWADITGKPTTIGGYGITDGVTNSSLASTLLGYKQVVSEGNIEEGANVTITGVFTNRFATPGNTKISVNSFPWGSLTGRPSSLAGYGLDDEVYTKSQVDYLDNQRALVSHTHTSAVITDFTTAVRNKLSAGTGISYNSATGVISATGGGGGDVRVGTQAQRRATNGPTGTLWIQTDAGAFGGGLYYYYPTGPVWIKVPLGDLDVTFTSGGAT